MRGFGRVWVAFEAVFQSGVRFPCSLCFALFFMFPSQCPPSLSPQALRPLREERDCAGATARLTLNSLLARETGCHSKVLLLGTNADGGVAGVATPTSGARRKAMNCQPSATSASGNGTHDHTPLRPSVRYPNLSPSPAAENGGSILDLGEVGPVWYLFDRSSLSHSVWRST